MVVVLVVMLAVLASVQGQMNDMCIKTPMNFRELFIAQCMNFTSMDCNLVWTNFADAFAFKSPQEVTSSNYNDYLGLFPINPPMSTTLFWSGTMNLVDMLNAMCSKANLTSSAEITSNAILNNVQRDNQIANLVWCGTDNASSPDGIEYGCNRQCNLASGAFYEEFSRRFALAATGIVFYLGYGERPNGTFGNQSFFAKFELPNINPAVVPKAVILVVHNKGQGESCGNGTLSTLNNAFMNRNIMPTCYNIYGNLSNSSELPSITDCAVRIVASIQKGRTPEPNDCFSAGSSAATVNVSVFIIMALTLLVVVLLH